MSHIISRWEMVLFRWILDSHWLSQVSERARCSQVQDVGVVLGKYEWKHWVLHQIAMRTSRCSVQVHEVVEIGQVAFNPLCGHCRKSRVEQFRICWWCGYWSKGGVGNQLLSNVTGEVQIGRSNKSTLLRTTRNDLNEWLPVVLGLEYKEKTAACHKEFEGTIFQCIASA